MDNTAQYFKFVQTPSAVIWKIDLRPQVEAAKKEKKRFEDTVQYKLQHILK